MKRYLKLKDFKIYPRNSSFNDVMDDVLNTLCFDTEFQKFAKENYGFDYKQYFIYNIIDLSLPKIYLLCY
jgi:hypothetical protein